MSTDAKHFPDEEYQLPCAEAMLAGTLALMTGHAQACCEGPRQLMAAKVVSNLGELQQHPLLSPPFRAALGNLRARWQLLQGRPGEAAGEPDPQRLWHPPARALQ